MPRPRLLLPLMVACLALPRLASGTSLVVPDDAPTIQSGMDAGADTVRIRPGVYADLLAPCRDVVLLAAESEMPVLSSVSLGCDGAGVLFKRLAFSAPVVVGVPLESGMKANPARVQNVANVCYRFEECDLRAGVVNNQDYIDVNCVEFFKCQISGTAEMVLQTHCYVESCYVRGRVFAPSDAGLRVLGSTFEGDGTGTAIGYGSGGGGFRCEGNTIRNYARGVYVGVDDLAYIRDNLVEDCSNTGIEVAIHGTVMDRNIVRNCGYGIYVSGGGTIRDNLVENCSQKGVVLDLNSSDVNFANNVISGCTGDGLYVWSEPYHALLTQNTIAGNGGSGIVMEILPMYISDVHVRQNIASGNGGYGIRWIGDNTASMQTCNDWYDNDAGTSLGEPPGSDDFSVDPLFCDVANGDFRLHSSSPLVSWPDCGQIGALGVGCSPSAVPPVAAAFVLAPVKPNPSSGPARIGFGLPHAAEIRIDVFDLQGRLVATPARGKWSSGTHSVEWSAGSAGVYLVRYRFPGGEDRRRLVRIP